MASQDRALALAAWRETIAFDSRPRLTRIGYSTLVLAGSIDSAVAMNHARMLHDGIPGARLVAVDGAGHALIWTTTRVPVRHRRIPRCVTGGHPCAEPIRATSSAAGWRVLLAVERYSRRYRWIWRRARLGDGCWACMAGQRTGAPVSLLAACRCGSIGQVAGVIANQQISWMPDSSMIGSGCG